MRCPRVFYSPRVEGITRDSLNPRGQSTTNDEEELQSFLLAIHSSLISSLGFGIKVLQSHNLGASCYSKTLPCVLLLCVVSCRFFFLLLLLLVFFFFSFTPWDLCELLYPPLNVTDAPWHIDKIVVIQYIIWVELCQEDLDHSHGMRLSNKILSRKEYTNYYSHMALLTRFIYPLAFCCRDFKNFRAFCALKWGKCSKLHLIL